MWPHLGPLLRVSPPVTLVAPECTTNLRNFCTETAMMNRSGLDQLKTIRGGLSRSGGSYCILSQAFDEHPGNSGWIAPGHGFN
jgi:hypothetical protein